MINSINSQQFAWRWDLCNKWQLQVKSVSRTFVTPPHFLRLGWVIWTVSTVVRAEGGGSFCIPKIQWFILFLISNFRRVLNLVCILLGISPASDCGLPTFRSPLSVPSSRAGCKVVYRCFVTLYQFHLQGLDVKYTLHPALEDGTNRGFRNVGKPQSDAGEIPKRIHTLSLFAYWASRCMGEWCHRPTHYYFVSRGWGVLFIFFIIRARG